jgi:hypothetical protein
MEEEGSLPYSQEPNTGSYPEIYTYHTVLLLGTMGWTCG